MRRRRRALGALALLFAGLLATGAAAQTPASLQVRIREVSFDSAGNTRMVVSVTGAAVGAAVLPPGVFAVTEEATPVTGLKVEPLFASRAQPVSVALVMDVSQSTAGAPLQTAKDAAKRFASGLPADVKVAVIAFGTRAELRVDFTTNRQRVIQTIDALAIAGRTSLYDAIVLASDRLGRETGSQHNAVLFSDGNDSSSRASLGDAVRAARTARAPVTAVLLQTGGVDAGALRQLAGAVKGGEFLAVTNTAQLGAAFARVAQAISSQYVLTYAADAQEPRELDLAVSVTTGGTTAADQSVVINERRQLSAGPPLSSSKPLVPFLGSKLGYYVGIAAAFLVALLFLGTLLLRPSRSKAEQVLARGLRLYMRSDRREKKHQEQEGFLSGTSVGRKAVEIAGRVPRSKQFDEKMQKSIDQAGWPLRSTEFLLLQVGGVLVGAILGFGLFGRWWIGVLLIIVGALAPQLVLSQRITKRNSNFLSQLPDTLQLLSGSLQAGYGFMQALDTVAKESPAPTSVEFSRVLSEARLGMPAEDALDAMADRVGGEDFRWVVLAINIQRQVGGNLAALLTTVSNTLREREAVRRQINVLSAEGRLSAVILVVLPFALAGYLQFTNPKYLGELFAATVGKIAVAFALVLISIGIVWMRKIIKIDV